MITLHQQHNSGNCYKVRLILAHMGIPFRVAEINSLGGATHTPEFLGLNPNGKVPLVIFEDRRVLAESNAMLLYFARGGRFLPDDPWGLAKTHEWLFFEQYSHEPAIAVRRTLLVYEERRNLATPHHMESLLVQGNAALGVMERRLAESEWLTGDEASVADLSLYAYTHMAREGGFDLRQFPAVSLWLDRVAAVPGHVDINWHPAG